MKRNRRILLGGVAALALFAGGLRAALWLTPFPAALENPAPGSVEFLDRSGRSLRTLLVEDRRIVRSCTLAEISPHLIAATLAAEDRRFRAHHGADWRALGRAMVDAVRRGHAGSGASTITQQLVKLADPGPRTLGRKLSEIWQALRIERSWGKDRILTEYLNRLDYGNLQTGIAAAGRFYFGKPPGDLSPAEAAFLSALPNAPTRLDPHQHLEAAQARQHWILSRMERLHRLDPAALARSLAEPLRLRPRGQQFLASDFVELLLRRRGAAPAQGGIVRTSLDLELNQFAAATLATNLSRLADKHATHGAVVVLDNRTREVRALTGPAARMVRSPGSAMKPFTYLLALERGAHPGTVVADVPTAFATEDGLYRPNNYNHRFYGPVSMRTALGNSLNVAAIRTLELAGGPEILQRAMRQVGITTLDQPAEYYGLGLTLGNGEVRLLELANAYATLGSLGRHRAFRLFLEGRAEAPERRVFDEGAAFLIAEMLADNHARTAAFGARSWLTFDFPVACKTGTSSDYRDNWAVGYTPEFTVAVWVGNIDGSPMRGITGVTGAAPVMHEIFCELHTRFGTGWFTAPQNVQTARIDPLTGRQCSAARPGAVMEKYVHLPAPERAEDYDARGRVRLPAEYAAWLSSRENQLGDRVIAADDARTLRILQPAPGTTFYIDGDLPAEAQQIALRAESASALELKWECASLVVGQNAAGPHAQVREGRHTIVAVNPATGQSAETWIEVKHW